MMSRNHNVIVLRKSSKLLTRKPWIRNVNDSDMRWLFAAYQLGMWRDVLSGDLPAKGFADKIMEIIAAAPYEWIVEAPGTDGVRPVALILGKKLGTGIEPFVEWFPWATNRNQMEATAVFLKEVSKQFKIFVFAAEHALPFWTRFVRYGMVRRGCKVIDYFSRGEHAMLFYTTKPQ